ncbi:MAG: hypothetical protein ACLS28_01450 [Clostridium neonatale]
MSCFGRNRTSYNSISIKSLSQLLNLDISFIMSRTVDNLIAKNYAIKMKSDKDKRIFIVKLTDEGSDYSIQLKIK